MLPSVYNLRDFYRTLGGRIVRRLLRTRLTALWPDAAGQRVLGLGYAAPYLRPYMAASERALCVMTRGQGVHLWPDGAANLACLADATDLPVETNTIDRLLVVHALEHTGAADDVLAELWRILKGNGRIIVVVPNRHGLWARADWTPFGTGTPFSARQVETLLKDNLFVVERRERALYIPPFRNQWLLRPAMLWERLGAALLPRLGGVVVIEASKQVYAASGKGRHSPARAAPARAAAAASCNHRDDGTAA